MRTQKRPSSSPVANAETSVGKWRTSLWLAAFGGMLIFWQPCLDRYLAPRFFFLSMALLAAGILCWKDLRAKTEKPAFHFFDLLLLGWWALNLLSVFWSFSWSEGVFYAQKTLLLFGVYWLLRHALQRRHTAITQSLGQIFLATSVIVCAVLLVQISLAATERGLNNDALYDYASGLFGNKSLAAEFLFFLLIFNIWFAPETENIRMKRLRRALIVLLLGLILVLQVRTVYLALAVSSLLYVVLRVYSDRSFRPIFLKKILPAGLAALAMGFGLLLWKGGDSSLAERLNPLHYLNSDTANERRFVWYKTDLLNADHYWLGVGNGSWKFWMPSKKLEGAYRLTESSVVFTRAHNDYLEIRAEMGIFGALYFCGLFAAAFWLMFRAARKNPAARHELLWAATALLGYCVIQYFDFPRERIEFQVVLGLLFALAVTAHAQPGGRSNEVFGKVAATVLGLGLLFNLAIGWSRMSGEIHNVRMMEAQARGDWRKVAAEAVLAENRFYEYTDAATPLAWHEGIGLYQQGQFDRAVAAFEKAYRLNPWEFQVINNYASALVKTQRYQEAIPLFEKALDINPRYDEGKFNLSYVYFQLADYSRASEMLNLVDTIPNATLAADREKNRVTLQQLATFRKAIAEKQGGK